jgi:hypothetical protein
MAIDDHQRSASQWSLSPAGVARLKAKGAKFVLKTTMVGQRQQMQQDDGQMPLETRDIMYWFPKS